MTLREKYGKVEADSQKIYISELRGLFGLVSCITSLGLVNIGIT
jgi:hypothetical protein